jgi:hypothetical protein
MPAYEKVECEECGEMVSMHPMSQKKHQRECKRSPVENEIKEEVKTVEVKAEVKPADDKTAELYKIAMQALEVRKTAPELFVAGVHTDERHELVARYAPDCIDPIYDPRLGKPREFAPMHAYFSSPKRVAIMAHKGYVPVLDENNLHVQHEGDLLMKIPRDMYLAKEVSASNESKVRREGQTDAEIEMLRGGGGNGTTVESSRKSEILN